MNKIFAVGIMLLFLGSSIPALAKTTYVGAKTTPSHAASSAVNYTVYIGAGIFRHHEEKFGWGWHEAVMNTGDTNITVYTNETETTIFGKLIGYNSGNFTLRPGMGSGGGSVALLDFHPFERLTLTIRIENTTFSKSGYMIGPFVLFVG
jgi:hypothetical protein